MKLNDPFIITIGREIGTGGGTVGRKLAEKLNVPYTNKELIQALEEKFNLTMGGIEHLKSTKKNWFADLFEQVAPAPKAAMGIMSLTIAILKVFGTPNKCFVSQYKKPDCINPAITTKNAACTITGSLPNPSNPSSSDTIPKTSKIVMAPEKANSAGM